MGASVNTFLGCFVEPSVGSPYKGLKAGQVKTLVGTLLGTLMGTLVSAFVGALVGALVRSSSCFVSSVLI